MALEKHLDPAPEDPEDPVGLALDPVSAFPAGSVDTMIGLEVRPGGGSAQPRGGGPGCSGDNAATQLLEAAAGRGRGGEDVDCRLLELPSPFRQLCGDLVRGDEIGLRQQHQLWQRLEPGAVGTQLGSDRLVVLLRASLGGGDLHQVHQQRAALDVAEELVPEAGAVPGAFDQSRDVGDDDAAVGRSSTMPSCGSSVVNG